MKAAKILLWICGIGCMWGFVMAVMPWHFLMTWFEWFGVQTPDGHPVTVFVFRICFTLFGLIGFFFMILARNPLGYGAMLTLAAYGLIFYGLISLGGGIRYGLPVWTFAGDFVFAVGSGSYLIVFRKKDA